MEADYKQMISDLTGQMDKLNKLQNVAFSRLKPEQLEAIAPIQKEIATAMDAMKKGNTKVLNEILERYADINRTK